MECRERFKMAAKDRAGHQEFPQVVHDIPPREEIEEATAIAENLLEGHQGLGQGLEDPYTCAVHYLEKHRIVEILQVTMETHPLNQCMVASGHCKLHKQGVQSLQAMYSPK